MNCPTCVTVNNVAETDARSKSDAALEVERAAKAEATRRFREALEAVDKSLTGLSDVLTYFPGVEPVRLALLEEAARDLERFASERSDVSAHHGQVGRSGRAGKDAGRARAV